ncbi:MAG: septum formation family protein [Nakamurella sp.]
MDRRWWGAAVVALVLLSALILPGIAGARLTGSAQRAPIAGAPAVGDCLQNDPTGRRAAFDSPGTRVFSGAVGPCAERNFGEVVSVQDVDTFRGSSTERSAVIDPAACQFPAADYLGWSEPDTPVDAAGWMPSALQNLVLFGPDSSQFRVGQRWLACVLLPRTAPYSGSMRDTRPGPAIDALGSCRATANDTADGYVPCGDPHISEVFGVGAVGPADVPELLQACRGIITLEAGLADPTAGGSLSIWVEAGGSFGDPAQRGHVRKSAGKCTVAATGGRQLGASLLGVGDGPLPWAS